MSDGPSCKLVSPFRAFASGIAAISFTFGSPGVLKTEGIDGERSRRVRVESRPVPSDHSEYIWGILGYTKQTGDASEVV
ncbi:MAG: hypothetical protein ALECFALPRED_005530 [Alectoria fallacina]|uniref:Uncharacterized protein n=1 Tax=Alectoria fallacina TaxID=1903189 RepID=A0A8H3IUT8_9LECA|nr:MAG: hypothetical protein ALECFALPRED_005530 [Alectoria fallacina]